MWCHICGMFLALPKLKYVEQNHKMSSCFETGAALLIDEHWPIVYNAQKSVLFVSNMQGGNNNVVVV